VYQTTFKDYLLHGAVVHSVKAAWADDVHRLNIVLWCGHTLPYDPNKKYPIVFLFSGIG